MTFKFTNLSEKDQLIFNNEFIRKINLIFGFLTKLKICERLLSSYRVHYDRGYEFSQNFNFIGLWNVVRQLEEYVFLLINQESIYSLNVKDIFSCKDLLEKSISRIHSKIFKPQIRIFLEQLCSACVNFVIGNDFHMQKILDEFIFLLAHFT